MFKFDTLGRILRDPDPDISAGGKVDNWITSMPDDVKDGIPEGVSSDPNFTKYKDFPEFLKGHSNLSKMIGEKGVIIPKDDASPEDIDKFYNTLGRPEKSEGYEISPVEGLHESINIDEGSVSAFKDMAHKAGLTNKQANQLNGLYLDAISQNAAQSAKLEQDSIANADTELRKEWGDKFDSNKKSVANMIIKAGGQDAIDAMGGVDGLGNNPVVLKALGKIAGLVGEDSINGIITSPAAGQSGNESKQDAMTKIGAMNSDKSHAVWNDRDPDHSKAVKERQRLYGIAYSEGGV